MNLTWELHRGPVGRWVRATLPDVDLLEPSWRAATAALSTRRPRRAGPDGPDWPTLGLAIQHRIGVALAADPPMAAFRGCALVDATASVELLVDAYEQGGTPGASPTMSTGQADFATRLGQFVGRYDLAAPQPVGVEHTLAKVLWVLALWEGAYRGDEPVWWPGAAAAAWSAQDWLALAPDYAVADVAGVGELFTRRGHADLQATAGPGAVTVGPVYVPGWAEADMVIGSTMVDVKATVHPQRLNPTWIWQLCCYAWLDGHIDTIAVHLPRQGRTVSLDLTTTVETISGGGDASVLAGQAREIMREAAARVGKQMP